MASTAQIYQRGCEATLHLKASAMQAGVRIGLQRGCGRMQIAATNRLTRKKRVLGSVFPEWDQRVCVTPQTIEEQQGR